MTPSAQAIDTSRGLPASRRVLRAAISAVAFLSLVPLTVAPFLAVLGADVAGLPFYLVFLLLPANLAVVGTILATRRPENRIGWLLLLAGALAGVSFACGEWQRF